MNNCGYINIVNKIFALLEEIVGSRFFCSDDKSKNRFHTQLSWASPTFTVITSGCDELSSPFLG